jgi:hypothetical protein
MNQGVSGVLLDVTQIANLGIGRSDAGTHHALVLVAS